ESAKLSAQQAFYDIAKASAIDVNDQNQKCFSKQYNGGNIIQFTDSCRPATETVKKMFASEYEKNMKNFVSSYPEGKPMEMNSALEENTISTSAKTGFSAIQKSAYAEYSLSGDFYEKITVDLAEERIALGDFAEIYSESIDAVNACKNEGDMKSCIEGKITMDRWDAAATPESGWVLLEFSTKKRFFFDENGEKFGKITAKCGISL
ncbi:MAG: hypothetical protein WC475_03810, partial [Candidatus Paceibacterota bacterium]